MGQKCLQTLRSLRWQLLFLTTGGYIWRLPVLPLPPLGEGRDGGTAPAKGMRPALQPIE